MNRPFSLRQSRFLSMFACTLRMMVSNSAVSGLIFFHDLSAAPRPTRFGYSCQNCSKRLSRVVEWAAAGGSAVPWAVSTVRLSP